MFVEHKYIIEKIFEYQYKFKTIDQGMTYEKATAIA
jgi:hypothetical protein